VTSSTSNCNYDYLSVTLSLLSSYILHIAFCGEGRGPCPPCLVASQEQDYPSYLLCSLQEAFCAVLSVLLRPVTSSGVSRAMRLDGSARLQQTPLHTITLGTTQRIRALLISQQSWLLYMSELLLGRGQFHQYHKRKHRRRYEKESPGSAAKHFSGCH
jgi:hypothetical protein